MERIIDITIKDPGYLNDAHRHGEPPLRVARLLQQPLVRHHVLRPLRVHIQCIPGGEAVEVRQERVLEGWRDLRGRGSAAGSTEIAEAGEHLVVHLEADLKGRGAAAALAEGRRRQRRRGRGGETAASVEGSGGGVGGGEGRRRRRGK